CARVNTEFDYW
nr:immunoglobulin heavy chain junction region [Macaca mulatta]MOV50236.1 immunoglobulin heavy chain junction region [Macaca mulatta]MOV50575.1 immunoglobulin heavy chain junction region [Macaca mulatta]MOV51846.1 immunoglobulin heavy chain junction region [Macaca mulatta]MOV51975.1 immunoglobulin heavy chain junction region [Macaca mulatta]